MSGETVKGNALQFTNDNKRCYAYTGIITATGDGTYTEHLDFNTQSEYIKARVMIQYGEPSSDNLEWQILFNNIVIANSNSQITSTSNTMPDFIDLIVPPFTNFIWQITNSSSVTGRDVTCTFIGKVGMAPRVGNLIE
tara:strand:+ start:73 stop:486 length:414 start_codon:yes stop_codon:yes gene_type:complete